MYNLISNRWLSTYFRQFKVDELSNSLKHERINLKLKCWNLFEIFLKVYFVSNERWILMSLPRVLCTVCMNFDFFIFDWCKICNHSQLKLVCTFNLSSTFGLNSIKKVSSITLLRSRLLQLKLLFIIIATSNESGNDLIPPHHDSSP